MLQTDPIEDVKSIYYFIIIIIIIIIIIMDLI